MKILDRYIIRQFAVNFLILLFVLNSLFIMIDLMLDLDEFVDAAQKRAADASWDGLTLQLVLTMFDFHGPMVVLVYVFLSGLVVVAAVGFTFNGLTRNRELVAIVTSGISMYRIAAPVVVAGIFLNALALPIQEYVIPRLAPRLARTKSQLKHGDAARYSIHYQADSVGNLFSAGRFDAQSLTLRGVMIREVADDGTFLRRISADEAVWDQRREGWNLVQGHASSVVPGSSDVADGMFSDDESIEFFSTDLSPQALLARRATIFPRLLSLQDLQSLANNPNVDQRQIRQIMHSRFSLLVVNVLILVMSLGFFLVREPSNLLALAVKAASLTLSAYFNAVVVMQLGATFLNPVAAAWLPVVVYLPVCVMMLQSVKT